MAKLKNNNDLVKDLMNFSPYGALCQIFIIEAISRYCEEVKAHEIEEDEEGRIPFISPEAWKGVAEDISKRMEDFYNEQNKKRS